MGWVGGVVVEKKTMAWDVQKFPWAKGHGVDVWPSTILRIFPPLSHCPFSQRQSLFASRKKGVGWHRRCCVLFDDTRLLGSRRKEGLQAAALGYLFFWGSRTTVQVVTIGWPTNQQRKRKTELKKMIPDQEFEFAKKCDASNVGGNTLPRLTCVHDKSATVGSQLMHIEILTVSFADVPLLLMGKHGWVGWTPSNASGPERCPVCKSTVH